MYGPKPAGFWTGHASTEPYRCLIPGKQYVVKVSFDDFDEHTHVPDETWTFLGWSYLPYDNGLSLFVSFDGENEWVIPLSCRPEDQGAVNDSLDTYLQEISVPDLA